MIKLSDIHKQKLWADFLAWSGGKNFYEVPLFGHGSQIGIDDFLQAHAGISGWLNTLPKYMHASVLEWVDHLQRSHLKRDADIQSTQSKDYMFNKEWISGYPKKFTAVPAMASEGFIGIVFYHPSLTQAQCKLANFLKVPAKGVMADLRVIASANSRLPEKSSPKIPFLATGVALEFGKEFDYVSLKLVPNTGCQKALGSIGIPSGETLMLRLLQVAKGSVDPKRFAQIRMSPMVIENYGYGQWNKKLEINHEVSASADDSCCLCIEDAVTECGCDCHHQIMEMAKSDAINLKRKSKYLLSLLEEMHDAGLVMPAWAQNKLSVAKNQISDVMDYVASQVQKNLMAHLPSEESEE